MSISFIILAQQNVDFSKKNFKNDLAGLEKALQNIEDGNIYYDIGPGAYRIALDFYMDANSFNPNNAELNFKIGQCLLYTYKIEESINYLQKAEKLQEKKEFPVNYYLGKAYNQQYKFKESIDSYILFLKEGSKKNKKFYEKLAQKGINESETAIELTKFSVVDDIENLGEQINSRYGEYSPVVSPKADTLYFTSRRKHDSGVLAYDSVDFQYFENVYYALSNRDSARWENVRIVPTLTDNYSHNAVIFKNDTAEIHYRADNNGDLFIKYKNEEIVPLPETVNSEFSETSAVLSADGNMLIFVSNREKDNFGGKDLYFTVKDTAGNWSEAQNMGSTINSEYDEDGLWLHPKDFALFFSSKGPGSMGGYDIFKTVKSDSGWTKPKNVGYPVNTPSNDIHFRISPTCKRIFFASDRPGGYGMQDIYVCTLNEKICFRLAMEGIVTSEEDSIPLFAFVQVFDKDDKEVFSNKTNVLTGKYIGFIPSGDDYTLLVNSENYLPHSEKFSISDSLPGFLTFRKDVQLTKAVKGNKIILAAVEFDFASAKLRETSFIALDKIAAYIIQNPTMKVEISGHTDNKGSKEINQKLSEDRAKAVVDYLLSKDVPKDQLVYQGYAFEKPIDTNETEEGRQRNRRVEFTILDQ
jgi:outer membrane protein OmpA-like peptidoglycan-associated protein/tetratricopeptide (TPR) repeat protein